MAGLEELPNCSKCPGNPALREVWGCDKPAQATVSVIPGEYGEDVEYRQCPSKCIPGSVHDFMDMLEDMKRFPLTAKPLHERGARWRAFDRYLRMKINEYEGRTKAR